MKRHLLLFCSASIALTMGLWSCADEMSQSHSDEECSSIVVERHFGEYPVCIREIFLAGRVADASGVERFSINGESLPLEDGHWTAFQSVTAGSNEFRLEVQHKGGIVSQKVLEVVAHSAFTLPDELRDRLIVVPLIVGGSPTYRVDLFTQAFSETLLETRMFRVVERGQLESILLEHELHRSDLASVENAVRVGRLLLAEHVVILRVSETADEFNAAARLVSVQSQEILWTTTFKSSSSLATESESLGRGIALSLAMLFTIQDAVILDSSAWPEVYVDKGFLDGLSEGVKVVSLNGERPRLLGRISEVQDCVAKAVFSVTETVFEPGQSVQVFGYMNLPKP